VAAGVLRASAPRGGRVRAGAAVPGAGLTRQDMAIAEQVVAEGRALVVAVNKVDTLAAAPGAATDGDAATDARARRVLDFVREQLDAMHGCRGTPVVALSALTGAGARRLLPVVEAVAERWASRVPTGTLNRWLALIARHHPPPMTTVTAGRATHGGAGGGRRHLARRIPLRIKYAVQSSARPPTFTLHVNRAPLPEAYQRYLASALREEFGLAGVPVRIRAKAADNPYRARAAPAAAARGAQALSRRGRRRPAAKAAAAKAAAAKAAAAEAPGRKGGEARTAAAAAAAAPPRMRTRARARGGARVRI